MELTWYKQLSDTSKFDFEELNEICNNDQFCVDLCPDNDVRMLLLSSIINMVVKDPDVYVNHAVMLYNFWGVENEIIFDTNSKLIEGIFKMYIGVGDYVNINSARALVSAMIMLQNQKSTKTKDVK